MVERKNKLKQPFFTISVDTIDFDEHNIRKTDTDISGLKQTISDVGLLQPILLHKKGDRYVVIDGGRRLRAMKDLGICDLIVGRDVVIDVEETAADVKFKQVIANIQREDVNDVELGHAFILLNEYGYQLKEIADIIGKTPHYVTAKVGLAKRLSPEVQALYVKDIEASKCTPDTLPDEPEHEDSPYVMSVKVVETIARLPVELQMPSYEAIKEKQMDKKEAIQFLQTIRKNTNLMAINSDNKENIATDSVKEERNFEISVKRYLNQLDKDIDRLAVKVKSNGHRSEEEVIPALESLIEKLLSLYSEIKTGRVNTDSQVMTT